jgi:hypothetical protein
MVKFVRRPGHIAFVNNSFRMQLLIYLMTFVRLQTPLAWAGLARQHQVAALGLSKVIGPLVLTAP